MCNFLLATKLCLVVSVQEALLQDCKQSLQNKHYQMKFGNEWSWLTSPSKTLDKSVAVVALKELMR